MYHYKRTPNATSHVRLNGEHRVRECLHQHCEKQVPDHYGFQLCERHLAKAWAAFEVLHGRTEEGITEERDPHVMKRGAGRRRGIVYFLEVNGQLKIGWTQNLKQRMYSLKASKVIWSTYGTRNDEKVYLRMFADHREHGQEWFALNDETRRMVEDLKPASIRQSV